MELEKRDAAIRLQAAVRGWHVRQHFVGQVAVQFNAICALIDGRSPGWNWPGARQTSSLAPVQAAEKCTYDETDLVSTGAISSYGRQPPGMQPLKKQEEQQSPSSPEAQTLEMCGHDVTAVSSTGTISSQNRQPPATDLQTKDGQHTSTVQTLMEKIDSSYQTTPQHEKSNMLLPTHVVVQNAIRTGISFELPHGELSPPRTIEQLNPSQESLATPPRLHGTDEQPYASHSGDFPRRGSLPVSPLLSSPAMTKGHRRRSEADIRTEMQWVQQALQSRIEHLLVKGGQSADPIPPRGSFLR